MSQTLADYLKKHNGDPAAAWKDMCQITDEHLEIVKWWMEEKGPHAGPGQYEHCLNSKPFAFGAAVTVAKAIYDAKQVQSSALDRAKAALTPSAETKYAYSGEFTFESEVYVSVQESYTDTLTVPWTTIKEIMQMIRKQAGME